jgi:hypothetical protein
MKKNGNRNRWNCVDIIPSMNGMEYSYLITDGKEISIGWYEEEYFSDNPEEESWFRSATWHDDKTFLRIDISGFPEVTHWRYLPSLP